MAPFVKLYQITNYEERCLPKPAFWRAKPDQAWVTNQFVRYLLQDEPFRSSSGSYSFGFAEYFANAGTRHWPWLGVRVIKPAIGDAGCVLAFIDAGGETVEQVTVTVRRPGIYVPCHVVPAPVAAWFEGINALMQDRGVMPSVGRRAADGADGFDTDGYTARYRQVSERLAGPHPGFWRPRDMGDALWAVPACWPLWRADPAATVDARSYMATAGFRERSASVHDMRCWLDVPALNAESAIAERVLQLLD